MQQPQMGFCALSAIFNPPRPVAADTPIASPSVISDLEECRSLLLKVVEHCGDDSHISPATFEKILDALQRQGVIQSVPE